MNSLLEWVVDGCGGYMRKNSGTFTSPEYPNFYPVNVICEWRIETDPGTKVQIVINELDLEGKNFNYLSACAKLSELYMTLLH